MARNQKNEESGSNSKESRFTRKSKTVKDKR